MTAAGHPDPVVAGQEAVSKQCPTAPHGARPSRSWQIGVNVGIPDPTPDTIVRDAVAHCREYLLIASSAAAGVAAIASGLVVVVRYC